MTGPADGRKGIFRASYGQRDFSLFEYPPPLNDWLWVKKIVIASCGVLSKKSLLKISECMGNVALGVLWYFF